MYVYCCDELVKWQTVWYLAQRRNEFRMRVRNLLSVKLGLFAQCEGIPPELII